MTGYRRNLYWAKLRPNELTPQVQEILDNVHDYGRRLADAYLATWDRLPDLEKRAEFLHHTQCRTIFGHDDPGDRRALVAAGFILASRLCDEVAFQPEGRTRQRAERVRALYQDLLDGKTVSLKESGINIVVHIDIREGMRVTELPRPPGFGDAAWEVHLGPSQQADEAREPSNWYGTISGAMWLRCIENDRRVLEGKITPETWMERWTILSRRNLFHVLMEPGMSTHLRQAFASITFNMMVSHYHTHRALVDKYGAAPVDPTIETWHALLKHISCGGLALMALVVPSTPRAQVLGAMHFEAGKRFGGSPRSTLDESIMATFARVSECDLQQLEARIRKRDKKQHDRRNLH